MPILRMVQVSPTKKRRGPKPTGNAREARLEVRLSAEEARQIAEAAAADSRTVSAWARLMLTRAAQAALAAR